ncbi:hypothetical protein CVU37_11575 [candidate division BRC1 bacterium HGW-BRC1-1]|jgi:tetratricopeptide (TPR) repeat protein|nr:MAG: hypothetical protein CVU37_11575 [candidate division BRC1 bacterium HGW-BRC1-1]
MDTAVATGFQQEVNQRIDAVELINHIGYAVDKVQVVGESIKCFCPIHKDARFRSLLVDTTRRTFKCTIKTCPGVSGGSLVDLAALALNLPRLDAAARVAHALKLPLDPEWYDKLASFALDEARVAAEAGNAEGREAAIRKAIAWHPSAAAPRMMLAQMLAEAGNLVAARDEYCQAAEVALEAGNHETANEVLTAATALLPEDEDILFMRIHGAELRNDTAMLAALLDQMASIREVAGRQADNVGVLTQLAELTPDDAQLHLRLANAHELRHDINNAATALEKAAELLTAEGKGDEAVLLLEKILQFDPGRLKMRARIADHLLQDGEYDRAKAHIFESVNLMMERGDLVLAAETVRKWFSVEPESVEAHESLARIATDMGDPAEAARELRACAEIFRAKNDHATTLEYLYRIKFQTPDDVALRRDIVDELRKSDKNQPAALECLDLAEVHHARSEPDEDTAALREAASLDPTPSFRLMVADILADRGRADDAADMALAAADAAESLGDTQTALECIGRFLQSKPDDVETIHRRVRLLWKADEEREAMAASADLAPHLMGPEKVAEARELLAEAAAHASLANGGQALALYRLASQAGTAHEAMAFYGAAVHELTTGDDFSEALSIALAGLELVPEEGRLLTDAARFAGEVGLHTDRAGYLVRLANQLNEAGEAHKAIEALGQALDSTPDEEPLRRRLADLQLQTSQRDEAQATWRDLLARQEALAPDDLDALLALNHEYLALFPEDQMTRRSLAEHLAGAGRLAEANRQFSVLLHAAEKAGDIPTELDVRQRLVQLEPDNSRLRIELAQACERAGDTPGAVQMLREIAHDCSGADKPEEAAEALRQAVLLEPEDPVLTLTLANAERTAGNMAAFKATLERLLELGEAGPGSEFYREESRRSLEQKRLKDARDETQRWLQFSPEDLDAREQLATIHIRQKHPRLAVENWLAVAEASRATDPERAARALRNVVETDPENTQARQSLSQVLLESGQEQEALEQMRQLADSLIDRRAYKEASTLLARILEYDTQSVDTLRRLASLVHEHEGFEKAAPNIRKLLAVMRESSAPDDVAAQYESIVKLQGADLSFRSEFADYLTELGRTAEAKSQMLQLAQVYRDEFNDPVRAIQLFGRATSQFPEPADARIFEEVASLHLALNVPEFAAEAFREAARLFLQQDDLAGAESVMLRLIDLPASLPADLARLGRIQHMQGREEEAAANLRRALDEGDAAASLSPGERREMCDLLLEADPHDVKAIIMLLDSLSVEEASSRSHEIQARLALDGKTAERTAVLRHAVTLSPDDIGLHRHLAGALREEGEQTLLAHELTILCRHAIEMNLPDDASTLLDELTDLPLDAEATLAVGDLLNSAGHTEKAVHRYCEAAQAFADADDETHAASALRNAAELSSSSLPSSSVAAIFRRTRGDRMLVPVVRDLLDKALKARNRTPSLLIGTALLETCTPKEVDELLRHIDKTAGSGFLATIGGAHTDWLLARDQTTEALRIIRLITETAPDTPESWWLASQIYRKVENMSAAGEASLKAAQLFSQAGAVTEEETCYREALEELPDDIGVLETLAHFYERERRLQESVEMMHRIVSMAEREDDAETTLRWLSRIVEVLPGDAVAREHIVQNLLKENRTGEAVTHLMKLAGDHVNAGRIEEAIATYEQAHVQQPNNAEILTCLVDLVTENNQPERFDKFSIALAEVHAANSDLKLAGLILNTLLQTHPDNLAAMTRLAEFSRQADDTRTEIRTLNRLGHKQAKARNYEAAVAAFERLHEIQPDDTDTMEMLVDCCVAGSMTDKAALYAVRQLDLARLNNDPVLLQKAAGKVLIIDADNPVALDAMGNCLAEETPTDAAKYLHRAAKQFEALGDVSGAALSLQKALELAPDDAGGWATLARHHKTLNDLPAQNQALMMQANVLAGKGEKAAAAKIVKSVLAGKDVETEIHEKALLIWKTIDDTKAAMVERIHLAGHYIKEGNYAAAEETIERGLTAEPENLELQEQRIALLKSSGRPEETTFHMRGLAERLLAAGELRRAADLYSELLTLTPHLIDVRRQLADLWRELGDNERADEETVEAMRLMLKDDEHESARELADELLAKRPGDVDIRHQVASVFLGEGRPEVASRWFVQAASMALQAGDQKRQMELLRMAVTARPGAPEYLEQLAEACVAAGENTQAADAYHRLVERHIEQHRFNDAVNAGKSLRALAPQDPKARRTLIDLYEKMGAREERIAEMQDLAALERSLGNVEEAVDVYRKLTQLKPDDVPLLQRYIELFEQVGNEVELLDDYLRLADAQVRQGQFVEATKTYEKLMAVNRRSTLGRERFIQFLQTLGQKSRAVAEMTKLAEIYTTSNRHEEATRTLQVAFGLNPENYELADMLAESAEKAGDVGEAVAACDTVAARLEKNDPQKAAALLKKLLNLSPERRDVRERLVALLERLSDKAGMVVQLRRLAEQLESEGSAAQAEPLRARATTLAGEARAELEKRADDHSAPPSRRYDDLVTLGDLQTESGDVDEALAAYNQARKIRDDNPVLIRKVIDCRLMVAPEHEALPDMLALAACHAHFGDARKAQEVYEQVLGIDPRNKKARTALGMI